MNVNYGVSNNTDWGQAIDRALIYPSTVPAYDADGNYGISTHAGEPITMLQPLIAVNLWTYNQKWKKFLGNTYLEWEIIKGLSIKHLFILNIRIGGKIILYLLIAMAHQG